jgi:hypothetical protein
MNRRKFLLGSGVAVVAAPLLSKLPVSAPPPTWHSTVTGRWLSGYVYPQRSRRALSLRELNDFWIARFDGRTA